MRICGLDEVGRGALAGPLIAAGVILNKPVAGLNDSKKLKYEIRNKIYERIINSGAEIETEIISARQINNRGMGWANKEIFRRLIRRSEAERFIVDGNLKLGKMKNKTIKCVVRADKTRKCVMAASIIAKVTRDRLMRVLHTQHPKYDWEKNVGYGTKKHIEAIREFGVGKYHRSVYVTTALSRDFPS